MLFLIFLAVFLTLHGKSSNSIAENGYGIIFDGVLEFTFDSTFDILNLVLVRLDRDGTCR